MLGEPVTPGVCPLYSSRYLQAAAERVVSEIGYGREITDNVRGFISVRLSSLRVHDRPVLKTATRSISEAMTRNVLFEIEDVGDDRQGVPDGNGADPAGRTSPMQARGRGRGASPGLRHPPASRKPTGSLRRPKDHRGGTAPPRTRWRCLPGCSRRSGRTARAWSSRSRSPPEIPDAVKNTAVKIVHRLPAADDREAVGATMNMTDAQSRYLVTLPPGQAAVFTDGMDYPVLAACWMAPAGKPPPPR